MTWEPIVIQLLRRANPCDHGPNSASNTPRRNGSTPVTSDHRRPAFPAASRRPARSPPRPAGPTHGKHECVGHPVSLSPRTPGPLLCHSLVKRVAQHRLSQPRVPPNPPSEPVALALSSRTRLLSLAACHGLRRLLPHLRRRVLCREFPYRRSPACHELPPRVRHLRLRRRVVR